VHDRSVTWWAEHKEFCLIQRTNTICFLHRLYPTGSVKGRGMTGEIKGWFSLRQNQILKALWWWSKESEQCVFPVVKIRFVFFCVTTPCSLVGKNPGDGDSTCKILTTTYQSTCYHKTTPYESSKHWLFSLHLSWLWITDRWIDMKAMHL